MPIAKHIYARAARDRIIDLLGIGETYPVRDVTVDEEQLTVDFEGPSSSQTGPAPRRPPCGSGGPSSFQSEPAQVDVDYALYEHGEPVTPPGEVTRVGQVVALEG